MHVAVVLESTLNKQNMGEHSPCGYEDLVIEIPLKYLTSERGIMGRPLDAIISDASPRYDSLEISYLRDLRRYKIVILCMFLPELYLPSYVSTPKKAAELAATTETEVAVEKTG
ncbi:hypothetical protein Tco_1177071 [Tanacetum coccineum]